MRIRELKSGDTLPFNGQHFEVLTNRVQTDGRCRLEIRNLPLKIQGTLILPAEARHRGYADTLHFRPRRAAQHPLPRPP